MKNGLSKTPDRMEFVIVVEGPADARTACGLADRVLVGCSPHWLDTHTYEAMRTWCGLVEDTPFTPWSDVKQLARERGIRYLGHLKSTGQPGSTDSAPGRKAIILHNRRTRDRNAPVLVLVRDLDSQPERREGLEQARSEPEANSLSIVIGTANPTREAWVLNGFVPATEEEEIRLTEIREELNLNPCTEAERLRGARDESRNAKRVLDTLTDGLIEREHRCWQDTDLATLKERGQTTGLTDYLNEVEDYLLPLLTDQND